MKTYLSNAQNLKSLVFVHFCVQKLYSILDFTSLNRFWASKVSYTGIIYRSQIIILLLFCFPLNICAQISVTVNTATPAMYEVYEIDIAHPKSYKNNWEDILITAEFTGPKKIVINGFYFDKNLWKVRFAPPLPGNWTYVITFTTPTETFHYNGSLTCTTSQTKGFLQRHPTNPFRLIYPDGTLYNGIGLGDCITDANADGTPLNDWGFDGGPIAPDRDCSRTGLDNYMNAYGIKGAGFNMFRWSTENCSFRLFNYITPAGNDYDAKAGMWGDTLVRSLRKNEMRLWLVLFGPPIFNNINGSTPLEEAAVKKYINYVVARYGAYVDIWELFNENFASAYYIDAITAYIRSIDPYHRLISISAEQPQLAAIDVNARHWYERESEFESDSRTVEMISIAKKFPKPIIFGEQGNSVQNWDEGSALRMRIRSWTAFFNEAMLIFWNTSCVKNFQHPISANIYLGPEERGYIKAMQDFTMHADSSIIPIHLYPMNNADVRAYGLKSSKLILGYFHHYSNHTNYTRVNFDYRMNRNGTLYWVNPENNKTLDSARLGYGRQTIKSPAFKIDIAMRIELDQTTPLFSAIDPLDVLVYPNPATTVLYINGNFNGTAIVELYNMAGRRVFTQANVTNDQALNIQNLSAGIYIYHIIVDQRQASGKVIVR